MLSVHFADFAAVHWAGMVSASDDGGGSALLTCSSCLELLQCGFSLSLLLSCELLLLILLLSLTLRLVLEFGFPGLSSRHLKRGLNWRRDSELLRGGWILGGAVVLALLLVAGISGDGGVGGRVGGARRLALLGDDGLGQRTRGIGVVLSRRHL